MAKRVLTFILALLMCLTLVPTVGYARDSAGDIIAFAAVSTPDSRPETEPETDPGAGSSGSTAAATPTVEAAEKLNILGLFRGVGNNADGSPNFDLNRAPNRAEAITMFVRLLGKETEAERGNWSIPFNDVEAWAMPYVGYAYENGLTTGTSETTFGSKSDATATQYLTFVLRALGYVSGTDFEWNRAWVLSDRLGFTDGRFNAATSAFTRGDAAAVSFDALRAPFKDSGKKLYEALIEAGIFSEAAAKNVGLITSVVPDEITVSPATANVEAGKTIQLAAAITPEDAEDKTITWSSSSPAIATVSNAGVVTGIAVGTATITAKTFNGKTATCTVTVTEALPFSIPKLDYEYGPLTIVNEISSTRYYTNTVSSLVFTSYKKYDFASYYYIDASIQGITDDNFCDIAVYFYDSGGRVIAQESILKSVTANVPYNINVDTFRVEGDILSRTEKIGFFSRSGREANTGSGSTGGAGDPGAGSGGSTGGSGDPGAGSGGSTAAPAYSVPVLNHEYGPFTVSNYYNSGSFWGSMAVSSFVFTKCELSSIGKYSLSYSVQGTASGSNNSFYLYFYDSGNRVLDKVLINLNVAKDQPFNTIGSHYVDKETVENAVRIDFYSYSGEESNSSGGGSTGGSGNNGGNTGGNTGGGSTNTSNDYEMYYGYDGIPSFSQFTNSGSSLVSIKPNMETIMYGSATESEINTYADVLEECGFSKSSMINAYIFTRGTVGDSAYREVRMSYTASPSGIGYVLNIIIAKLLPTNQQ